MSIARAHAAVRIGAVVLCFGAFGQEKALKPIEIRGVVVEAGTDQPIAGAELSLSCIAAASAKGAQPVVASTSSGPDGTYVFRPSELGGCRLYAKKEGYSGASARPFSLTQENPSAEVRLVLMHMARIVGRVVDDDTGDPIAGVHVQTPMVTARNGRLVVQVSSPEGVTDAEGQFSIAEVPPANRLVSIAPQSRSFAARLRVGFREEDFAATDQDFARAYWPGGGTSESALPLPVRGGDTVDFGVLRAKRVTYYRVRLSITPGGCGAAGRLAVFESTQPVVTLVGEPLRCGEEMLISGFLPGPHLLTLWADDGKNVTLGSARIPFVIKDENLKLTATLGRGMDVEGRFVAAENAKLPEVAKLGIDIRSGDTMGVMLDRRPAPPDAEGRFHLAELCCLNYDLRFSGIDRAHYIAEVRHNGKPIARNVPNPAAGVPVALEEHANAQLLEIVLDDKPATVMGKVMRDDDPAPNPYVLLLQTAQNLDPPVVARSAQGDDKGGFQFLGLPPGEYRLAALPSEQEFAQLTPGALARLWAGAKKVELGKREFRTVDLTLSEPPF